MEERLVYANKEQVWKLLTDCNYLSEWMPLVSNVEIIKDKFIAAESLLCVDIFLCNQNKVILLEVADYEEKKLISFYCEDKVFDVKYKFCLNDERNRLCSIVMKTECRINFWKTIGNKKVLQETISYGWRLLDALDQTLTKYSTELRIL